VTKAHLAHLDPLALQALQALQGPLEAEDPKALGSQTCSMASVQVTSPCPRKPASCANDAPRLCKQILRNRRGFCSNESSSYNRLRGGSVLAPEDEDWGQPNLNSLLSLLPRLSLTTRLFLLQTFPFSLSPGVVLVIKL
jgi:hypothetical protein